MKIVKRIAIWLGIAFLFIFIASIVIAVVFEDEIGQRLVAEINKELVNDLEVENFRLSLIKGFPNVSADLQNVVLPDNKKGVLLEAESMSFKIGLFGLLSSNLKVKSVVIEDGALFVSINRRGKANYLITKPSQNQAVATAETGTFALSLDEAILKNIELIYVDARAKQEMRLQVEEASFSGMFDNEQFSLASEADIQSDFVEIDGRRYFVGKQLGYDAKIYVDLENYFYEFQEVELAIDRNKFNIIGTVEPTLKYTEFDLNITAKKGSIESVIQLLPEDYKGFEGFESSGNFNFDATIKGKMDERENPVVNINFGLTNGHISHDILDDDIEDVSFAAKFRGGKTHTGRNSIFEINNFKGDFNDELIEAQLKISNLEAPTINFEMDGILPLESAYTWFDSPMITRGDGKMIFKGFQVNGKYSDMINPARIHRVKSNGTLELEKASILMNGQELVFNSGIFILKNNDLDVKNFIFESDGTKLKLDGSINNFLPVLLADSINSKDAKLRFNANLHADELDLDRLLALTEIPESYDNITSKGIDVIDSTKIENIQRKETITNFLEGTFVADIEEFNYDLVEGESFTGQLEFKNKKMTIVGEAAAMGGFFDIDAVGTFGKQPTIKAKIICNDINGKEFFRQGKNFGQEVLESRHVEGTLNTKMVVRAFWDAKGNFLYDDLKVLAGVKLTDGELNNFELFDEFSTYANSKDLKQVRIVDLENWFEIKNQHIYIPKMFVQSNAMNLFLSGEHTFENLIDYNIKVNAGQILLTKIKKHNSNLDPQPAKQKGLFNLYFNVSGDIDKYDIQTNKRKVKKQFEDSEYQKERIKRALALEFGRDKINRKLDKPADKIPEFDDSETEEFLDPIKGDTDNSRD